MFFLRVDYVPSCGGVKRVRGVYPSFQDALMALESFDSSTVLLARVELCSPVLDN